VALFPELYDVIMTNANNTRKTNYKHAMQSRVFQYVLVDLKIAGVDCTQLFQDISKKTAIRLGFPKVYNQWA